MTFNRYIADLLQKHDITQHQLAVAAGVHDSQVSRWLSGETLPSLPIAADLVRALRELTGEEVTLDSMLAEPIERAS